MDASAAFSRQQDDLRLFRPDQVRQAVRQLPALPAALPGLVCWQAAEGAVQVKVGGMYDLRHSYPSLGLHTSTHRVVSA